jgi:YHS domain-containing protein
MKTSLRLMLLIAITLTFTFGIFAQTGTTDVAKTQQMKPQSLCPVTGEKMTKDAYYDYNGERVYFCCKGCIEKFKADPEKYMKKMKENGEKAEKLEKTPKPAEQKSSEKKTN